MRFTFDDTKLRGLLYIICLLLGHHVYINAQLASDLNFQTIDNTKGLPNNFINEIEMDSLGFLWIATNDGLCRYDSPKQIKVFKSGQLGLNSSIIKALHAANDSILYIGTSFGGVTKFNILNNTHKTYSTRSTSKGQLSSDEILTIHAMDSGEVWVGTENGLNVIYPDSDSIFQFPIVKEADDQIQATAILDINQDDNGWIWIGTWEGSYYLYLPSVDGDHCNGTFRKFTLETENTPQHIWKIYQDSRKKYWIATHNYGLYSMSLPENASNQQTNQDWDPTFHKFRRDLTEDFDISSDYVLDIEEDSKGNLWIGTVFGLNILTPEEINNYDFTSTTPTTELNFIKHYHSTDKVNTLSSNHIKKIYRDKQDLMWLGSISGINQYNLYTNQFNVCNLSNNSTEDTNQFQLINSIYGLDSTTLLLASDINGLFTYDLTTKEVIPNKSFIGPQFDSRVSSFFKDENENKLYIGTSLGVGCIDMNVNMSKLVPFSSFSKEDINNLVITAIFKDSKGRIWGGTETGLFNFDEKTEQYNWFHHNHEDKTSLADNSVTQIFEDSKNNLWITTFNGISRLSEIDNQFKFENFKRADQGIGDNILSNKVSSVAEYNDKLYFGSRGGIFTYEHSNSSFKPLEGLRTQYTINAILISENGIIWASTSDGVLRLDLKNNESKLYGKLDGIGSISFRPNSAIKDDFEKFYFGGNKGFVQIDDSKIKRNTEAPEVYITDINTINSNSKNSYVGIKNSAICVPPDNYFISIDYTAVNYRQAENNQYAYKLEGFEDEEWNYTDKQEVVYTNLDPGEYVFKVKASNNEGIWNNEPKHIDVIVHAAFVETIWFKLLLTVLAIASLRIINLVYTKNIRKRNELLKGYNDRLNTQVKKTEAANTSLEEREKYMKILLERLDHSNKELLRSNKDLEQFAYVASHDMKEPLRTVGTFTTLLNRKYGAGLDSNAKEYMEFISEGVERMSSLINSLLSYSQVGKEDIEFKRSDLNDLVKAKIKDLSKIIQDKNVTIDCAELPSVYCATNQIGMVFYNLILNGIKFNKSQNPTISISSTENDTHYKFQVTDNGIGIPEKYQDQIFEIFKRLHSREEYEGTGIGLALCNKIIHRHNGTIAVNSASNEGTTFYFTISKDIKPTPQLVNEENGSELGQAVEEILRA